MRCLAKSIHGLRHLRGCLWLAPLLAAGVILLVMPAAADIYRYVDKDGVIHYTDDIDRVPAEYKDIVEQQKNVRRESSNPPDWRQTLPKESSDPPDWRQEIPVGDPAPNEPGGGAMPAIESPENEQPEAEAEPEPGTEIEPEPEPEPVIEKEEGAGEEAPESPSETGAVGGGEIGAGESAAVKHQLEQERQSLLEQKSVLASDKTYQKRKIKRKYQNRPHVQELMEEEARIDARLVEIEKAL